ncbi:phenylalanine--tRNA ligase subunit beta [Hahella sp. CCB-MM4]|uniref:phenylalanine--tRNA ligase subunit beta n=1 Tax=Hahella sp. (strain CCB-MM4) TaxID=1926491 RepID=UPI000B9AA340|nr:phenylalanine--tRNA ligase subunit beta [Hahella sp. CCB-MM4]OZG73995.1 phenylalanine--tRNA ligase subunit beta [Hahella sp. CCB-MM4]
MKFSERWLREWIDPKLSSEALVQQITMAGLEVDGTESVAKPFSGIVVAEVTGLEPHPDADKLRVCSVSDGKEVFQVVCGAPNVVAGMRVPFARIGAVLPGDFKIKKAKLRGIESHGMLCSEEELGLAEKSDGLMPLPKDAPLGVDVREYLSLDDTIIDVDLTPNRSDCLSLLGLAREVGALNKVTLDDPEVKAIPAINEDTFPVSIEAMEACPRYVGRVIRNADLSKPTPLWMIEKLRRSGIRSIDPVVDITNFVMLELGQPMHAFDLNELKDGIVVRMAKENEKLVLLDGQEISINEDTLVIADHEKPLALAGIMGGEHSGVSENTRDIFLESAFFAPLHIAGKARSYGLHTDSSHRFERGVDFAHQARAVERATQLLLDIVGGEPGPTTTVESKEHVPGREYVTLRHSRIDEVLGIHLDRTKVEELLARLGLVVEKVTKEGWTFKVPTHRFDISIEVDLIEEIARVYGYNKLPTTEPVGSMAIQPLPEKKTSLRRLKQHLVSLGYQEVITYSFVDPKLQALITPEQENIALANPIASDMSVMRTSLWAGLLKTAQYNQNRQQSRLKFFESGLTFVKEEGGIVQEPVLAGLIAGSKSPENWSQAKQSVDFFDAKGDVESLLGMIGDEFTWESTQHSALHPGQTAQICRNGQVVGTLGAVHPKIAKTLNLNGPLFIFELFLNRIADGKVPFFKGVSRFPEIRRDLAIIIDEATPYAEVAKSIIESAGEWRVRHHIFDVYHGESVGKGKKSLAIGVIWRHPERTLRDEEITEAFNNVIQELSNRLGASLRS